jgi:hypothetical protein
MPAVIEQPLGGKGGLMHTSSLRTFVFAAFLFSVPTAVTAEEPKETNAYMCDTEVQARRFAEVSLTSQVDAALRQVNTEFVDSKRPGVLACASMGVQFKVLKDLGGIRTGAGYMKLLEVLVEGWFFEGHFGGTPRVQYIFSTTKEI